MIEYNILDNKNGITEFSIESGLLNISKTFDCGQCFRWNRAFGEIDFSGVVGNRYIVMRDKGTDNINHKSVYLITESPDYLPTFLNYLGLNDDYSIIKDMDLTDYEKEAVKSGEGIRILNQDKWETIVSFIISQRNNIPKIKKTIDKLCEAFGEKKIKQFKLTKDREFYVFPTAKQILDGGIEKLDQCSLGYRSEYVYGVAKLYYENPEYFKNLENPDLSGDDVVEQLILIKGIGPKVANCIALFGYHKLDMFPIDVWIQRIIDREYNGNIDINRFGKLAGVIQQYLFYTEKKYSFGR